MSANSQPLIATIYNPHTQSKEALIAGFIARKQKFDRLFRDIRDSPMNKPEQHYLIQGIRGMGKTTLLLRIAYEIDNTPELRQRLIPVLFNEEEYGISTLADVWERTATYLGEKEESFADLYETMTQEYGQLDYEPRAFQTLITALQQQNKKILLLIDNIGDVLKKLDAKEEKRLREVLLTTAEVRVIGASSDLIEQVHDYTKPFFEFFKVIHLEGLGKQEALDLFQALSTIYHTHAVCQVIEKKPGRIEAIRRLTGGVIRTMVLLFEIMVENESGTVFQDLNQILDRVTPLYKHRMDDLPAQQQKIVAALALAWDAASTKELAASVRLESKVVSAQLKQLMTSGLVEKIETNTKNHLYRLEERFFNIWYLMRFGRKNDLRVLWLVRYFEYLFAGDAEWMQERLKDHIRAMETGQISPKEAVFVTDAFRPLLANDDLVLLDLLGKTYDYITKKAPQLAHELNYQELGDVAIWKDYLSALGPEMSGRNYQAALDILEKIKKPSGYVFYCKGTCNLYLRNYEKAEEMFKKSMHMNYGPSTYWLGRMYLDIYKDVDTAWNYLKKAAHQGDASAFTQMGIIKKIKKRYKDAFTYFDKAIESGEYWATIEAHELAYDRSDFDLIIFYQRLSKLIAAYTHSIQDDTLTDKYSFFTKLFYNLLGKKNSSELQSELEGLDALVLETELKSLLLNILNVWANNFDKIQAQTFGFLNEIRIRSYEHHTFSEENLAHRNMQLEFNNDALWLGYLVHRLFLMLLAKKQYHTAYNFFKQEQYQLRDRYKPLYYATLHFLQDEYPSEYLRMGPELQETVEDILIEVAQVAIDYA